MASLLTGENTQPDVTATEVRSQCTSGWVCFLASPPLASLKWAVEKVCLPVTTTRCKARHHAHIALVMCICSSTGSQPYVSSLLAKLSKRPSPAQPPIPASVLMQAGELSGRHHVI